MSAQEEPAGAPAGGLAPLFTFEPLMTLAIELGELTGLGPRPGGERRLARVAGGSFSGPRFSGRVLPGTTDWQWLHEDGTLEIDARYLLQTEQGALIEVENRGLRHGPPEVLAALAAGQPVDASRYFYATQLRFHSSAPACRALTLCLAVARARRLGGRVLFDVQALC